MPLSKEELENLIQRIDDSFEHTLLLRIRMARTRIIFGVAAFLAILLGYYYSRVAVNAAEANLLDLSVSLQSLSVAILALVISMVAIISNEEARRAESTRLEQKIFERMQCNIDPVVVRALIRMKMTLPNRISLEKAYIANADLFTEREFARRLLER